MSSNDLFAFGFRNTQGVPQTSPVRQAIILLPPLPTREKSDKSLPFETKIRRIADMERGQVNQIAAHMNK